MFLATGLIFGQFPRIRPEPGFQILKVFSSASVSDSMKANGE
jgi:hypothetical protein